MPTESDPVFVAVTSYVVIDPATKAPFTILEGSRYRLSSGFPSRHPEAWVEDGASTAEIGRAKAAIAATDEDVA